MSPSRSHAVARPSPALAPRRLAGLVLFSVGWLLWMGDMASWLMSS